MRLSNDLYRAIRQELEEECKRHWGEGYRAGYDTGHQVGKAEKGSIDCKSALDALADNGAVQSVEKGFGRTNDLSAFLGSLKDAKIKKCLCCGHIAATLHYCPHCGAFVESER